MMYVYILMPTTYVRGSYVYQTSWLDGDYYTEAQCEAVVMCGNNHWIIMPNLTRSIQIDSKGYVHAPMH